jgi:hypothetical protein
MFDAFFKLGGTLVIGDFRKQSFSTFKAAFISLLGSVL